MRRLMPMWASLVTVLLLMQWGGATGACLAQVDGPAMVLCHVADDSDVSQAGGPADHAGMTCPLCAPLPPLVLTDPYWLPVPASVLDRPMSERQTPSFAIAALVTAHQPRAPPSLA